MRRCSILFIVLLFAASARAQVASVSVRTTGTEHSVIVKFRTVDALQNANVLARIAGAGLDHSAMHPVFRRLPGRNFGDDRFGLDRIYQLPLREGIASADAVHSLAGLTQIE